MDVGRFSSNLQHPELSAILWQVLDILADGENAALEMELCKPNTYGVGGFFKAHQDTPRSEDLLGSLVIVLPTPHTGGELLLRHNEESWKVDFGSLTSDAAGNPKIGFVAFYSDVEHEVLPVTSGCRITLTYNLKWSSSPSARLPVDSIHHRALRHQATDHPQLTLGFARNPEYLPFGGVLGYHLNHQYPFSNTAALQGHIQDFIPRLKGSDRVL